MFTTTAANEKSWKQGAVSVYFGEKQGKFPDGNQVLVEGPEGRMLFDTPLSSRGRTALLKSADIVTLGHVHDDHVAALDLVPNDTPLYAPLQDQPALLSMAGMLAHLGYSESTQPKMTQQLTEEFHFMPQPRAQSYQDGMVWELGGDVRVRTIHMPGHTAGHSVLLVEPDNIAFIGDIDLSSFGPYYADACSSLSQFRETLKRMPALEAAAWITYHHKGVITERTEFLALLTKFEAKFDQREQAIMNTISAKGIDVKALEQQRFLYPVGYEAVFVEDAERTTLWAHLREMSENGKIKIEGERVMWS